MQFDDVLFRYKGTGAGVGPLSVALQRGDVWALLGANGAGKTTLMRVMSGELTSAHRGSHRTPQADSDDIVLLPQGARVPGRLTVLQVMTYMQHLKSGSGGPDGIKRALEAVDLTSLAARKSSQLSGGQLRRLLIAQAMIGPPSVLLLDEPSAGLDVQQREGLKQAVKRCAESSAVMLSTHIIDDVAGLADHVVHIVQGRAVFVGSAADYLARAGEGTDISHADGRRWTTAYQAWEAEGAGAA